jgi:AmmeMemoRadiSam system protein B
MFWCAVLALVCGASALVAQGQRPVRDDVGFCWDAAQMERFVRFLETAEDQPAVPQGFVAAISPHDDYLYAGRVMAPLFRSLRAKELILIGVTHRVVRNEIGDPKGVLILDAFETWYGPRGPVRISPLRERIRAEMDSSMLLVSNRAHMLEHSLEALIPFVQHYNPEARIVPLMVTIMDVDRMERVSARLAAIVARYCRERKRVLGKDLVFLISSDANHYGADFSNTPFGEDAAAHRQGTELDQSLIRDYLTGAVEKGKIRSLTERLEEVVWCGRYSVPFGILAASQTHALLTGKGLRGQLVRYSDTYSEGVLPLRQTGMGTTAPFSLRHWVGFFSMVFVPEQSSKK